MMAQTTAGGSERLPPPSRRLALAQAALDAALGVPGVRGTDAGPFGVYMTAAAGQRLPGIVCAATRDGGYEVSIRLVADMVELPALGKRVMSAVRRAARTTGVSLDEVSVHFADISAPGVADAGD